MSSSGEVGEVPSFDGAPRWPVDQDKVRLQMSDKLVARFPGVFQRASDRITAAPRGSKLRRRLLTRSLVAGWAAFDEQDVDYLGRVYDPEVFFDVRFEMLEHSGRHEGFEALHGFWRDWWSVGELDARLDEIIDPGGPFVAVVMRQVLTGAGSGVQVAQPFVTLYEIDRGFVIGQWVCEDEADAESALRERLASIAA